MSILGYIFYGLETVAMLGIMISLIIAIIDSLKQYMEELETEEMKKFDIKVYNDFELLYIGVAEGDRADRQYWLECVRGI